MAGEQQLTSERDPLPTLHARWWPPILLAGIFWAFYFTLAAVEVSTFTRFMTRLASIGLFALLFVGWWLFSRRMGLVDRLKVLAVLIVGGVIAHFFAHPSAGGFALVMFALPVVLTTWAVWIAASRNASSQVQRVGMVLVILLTWSYFDLIRVNGIDGEQRAEVDWRWQASSEELFLAESAARTAKRPPAATVDTDPEELLGSPTDWPEFRGADRTGIVRNQSINVDWQNNPPRLVWKQRIGPGWSSFALVGNYLFTQEQRGDQEATVCYYAADGREVWVHNDITRFWENVAGAGPRATPTFHEGRIYSLGANGRLNCLHATTGALIWTCDITADSQGTVPQWGYSSSPLIVDQVAIVFGETKQAGLLAYSLENGKLVWSAEAGTMSYNSAQKISLGGVIQVLFLSDRGLLSFDPVTGQKLWEHVMPTQTATRVCQSQRLSDTEVLVGSGDDIGVVRLQVIREGEVWQTKSMWASKGIKPSFNDLVVHDGHAFGFDGNILACADLADGRRRWKGGRYGFGQMLLLADQGLLMVLAENGEVVLVAANPERLEERGRFQAITGKTWNHPVVARGRLYVRNAEEMACYQLD